MTPAPAAVSAAKTTPELRAEYFRAFAYAKKYTPALTRAEFRAQVTHEAKDCDLLDTREGPDGIAPALTPSPSIWVCLAWGVAEEHMASYADDQEARRANDHGEND